MGPLGLWRSPTDPLSPSLNYRRLLTTITRLETQLATLRACWWTYWFPTREYRDQVLIKVAALEHLRILRDVLDFTGDPGDLDPRG